MAQNCSCHGSGDKHSQTVAAVLQRPRYSPGLILEDSDLSAAVDYTRSLSRLLFRNLLGCGVICGLGVSAKRECGLEITVAPGLALDGCGDPIEVPRPITITIDRNELAKIESGHSREEPAEFWVVLCGREKMCAPRPLVCDSDDYDGLTQPTRIQALAEISLATRRPECVCGCQRAPARDAAPPPAPSAAGANPHAETVEATEDVYCHHDHEYRVECAPDCGCGTACARACCLLLARISLDMTGDEPEWKPVIRGVRRVIRLAMLPDPWERSQDRSLAPPQATDFYWGEMDDSSRQEAMEALYGRREIGTLITADMVAKMAEYWNARRIRGTAGQQAPIAEAVDATTGKTRPKKESQAAAAKAATAEKPAEDGGDKPQ